MSRKFAIMQFCESGWKPMTSTPNSSSGAHHSYTLDTVLGKLNSEPDLHEGFPSVRSSWRSAP